MAATYESVGDGPGTNGGSSVIVKPTGLAAGDLMIACISYEAAPASATPPSGSWSLIRSTSATGGTIKSWSKIADSSDAAASDFTWTVSGGGNNRACMLRISSAGTVTYDTEATSTTTTVTMSAGSMTGHSLYVVAGGTNHDGTWVQPTGMTERFDANTAISGATSIGVSTGTAPTFTEVGRSSAAGFMAVHGFFINESVASGPANLKSYNTNSKANIKSINGNLIANIKSLNSNA